MQDVIQLYQSMFGPLTSGQRDKLYQAYDEGMAPFVMGCAMLRAKQEQRQKTKAGRIKRISFNYIWAIIEDWLVHGLLDEQRFRCYWDDMQRRSVQGGGRSRGKADLQKTRADFQYSNPEPPPKGFFSFLDE